MPAHEPDEATTGPGEVGTEPEPGPEPALEAELEALEEAVDRLLEEHAGLREGLARLESTQRTLGEALAEGADGGGASADAVERLREMAEENRRLGRIVEEGRERAERIRRRLIVMEDDLA